MQCPRERWPVWGSLAAREAPEGKGAWTIDAKILGSRSASSWITTELVFCAAPFSPPLLLYVCRARVVSPSCVKQPLRTRAARPIASSPQACLSSTRLLSEVATSTSKPISATPPPSRRRSIDPKIRDTRSGLLCHRRPSPRRPLQTVFHTPSTHHATKGGYLDLIPDPRRGRHHGRWTQRTPTEV